MTSTEHFEQSDGLAPIGARNRGEARQSFVSWAASGVADIRERASRRTTLSQGLSGRRNSLGVIRLLLATAVIVSHAVPLSGRGEDPFLRWSLNQENLGGFAVIGFFAISGYLIAKSGTRNDIVQFMWARFLRIFPAFFAVIGVSAFIIGPAIWLSMGRSLGAYFAVGAGGPIDYIRVNWTLTIHQWGINDIFASSTPYGEQVGGSVFNGSLWTLSYEWFCYLAIGVLVLFGVLSRFKILVPILTITLFALQVARFSGAGFASVVPWLGDPLKINLMLIFMIGACFALYADRIILDDRLGLFCLVVAVVTVFRGGFETVGYPAFAYALLWMAARLPRGLQWIGSKNDYSYGMYLYGFLIEQVIAYFGWYRWGYFPFVLVAILLTAGCAWLSWHAVEKHALALKNRGPGRGIRYWAARLQRKKPRDLPGLQ